MQKYRNLNLTFQLKIQVNVNNVIEIIEICLNLSKVFPNFQLKNLVFFVLSHN